MWQLQVSDFTEQEERVAVILIGNIDDHGYLKAKDEDGQVVGSDNIISMVCRETGLSTDHRDDVIAADNLPVLIFGLEISMIIDVADQNDRHALFLFGEV